MIFFIRQNSKTLKCTKFKCTINNLHKFIYPCYPSYSKQLRYVALSLSDQPPPQQPEPLFWFYQYWLAFYWNLYKCILKFVLWVSDFLHPTWKFEIYLCFVCINYLFLIVEYCFILWKYLDLFTNWWILTLVLFIRNKISLFLEMSFCTDMYSLFFKLLI